MFAIILWYFKGKEGTNVPTVTIMWEKTSTQAYFMKKSTKLSIRVDQKCTQGYVNQRVCNKIDIQSFLEHKYYYPK